MNWKWDGTEIIKQKDEVLLLRLTATTENIMGKDLVVMFSKKNCGFCDQMTQVIDETKPQLPKVKFLIIDGDEEPFFRDKFGIKAAPAFLIFKEGELVGKFAGAKTKEEFINLINNPIVEGK